MTTVVNVNEAIDLPTSELATWLLAWLEASGAVVGLTADQRLQVNLDLIRDMDHARADRLSRVILGLRHELRELLIDRTASSNSVH